MKRNNLGFTLVELLIVIALIAILSVAVLATINPIEQSNKARDARVQNDAAEVLNAYERYYANKQSYPWNDVANSAITTVDLAYFGRSVDVGFGLCGAAQPTSEQYPCSAQDTAGVLISTQELKNSFLTKTYTQPQSATGYSYQNELYVVKLDSTQGNSIYVCYVPKSSANRTPSANATWKMKALSFSGGSEGAALPTAVRDATASEITAAKYATLLGQSGNDTLFRCVPE